MFNVNVLWVLLMVIYINIFGFIHHVHFQERGLELGYWKHVHTTCSSTLLIWQKNSHVNLVFHYISLIFIIVIIFFLAVLQLLVKHALLCHHSDGVNFVKRSYQQHPSLFRPFSHGLMSWRTLFFHPCTSYRTNSWCSFLES